jgi:hypothetical protein
VKWCGITPHTSHGLNFASSVIQFHGLVFIVSVRGCSPLGGGWKALVSSVFPMVISWNDDVMLPTLPDSCMVVCAMRSVESCAVAFFLFFFFLFFLPCVHTSVPGGGLRLSLFTVLSDAVGSWATLSVAESVMAALDCPNLGV